MTSKYCKNMVAAVSLVILPGSAVANESCDVSADKTAIVFANGMFNLPSDAVNSMSVLRDRMVATGTLAKIAKDETSVRFLHVYNESEDVWTQLKEVLGQKVEDIAALVRKKFFLAELFGENEPIKTIESDGKEVDLDPYYMDENKLDDKDLERHIQEYRNLIRSGHRIITVSHSQGNFYSNQAFRVLNPNEQASYRQVQVASPASHVADGSRRFTTFANDLVMRFIPLSLSPKVLVGKIIPDPLAHSFDSSYMMTTTARNEVMKHITEAASAATFPNSNALAPLSVTLTWHNSAADLDLHVFEPSGLQVYQKAKVGKSGRLVIDATSGTTQELYLGNCTALRAGTFQLAVGNFKGNDVETGTLRITAGSEVHVKDFTIETSSAHPKGPLSVTKPHKITTVTIFTDEDGLPAFSFIDLQ